MNKRRIYYKGGVPYYKYGGKFYKLKKAQLGVDQSVVNNIGTSLMSAETDALQTDYKPNMWQQAGNIIRENPNMLMNYASNMLGSFDQSGADTDNDMASRMAGNFDSEGISNFGNTALDVASLIPGAAPVVQGIKGALNLGKAVGNLMPTDEYGETKTAAGQVVKDVLNPLGRFDDAREIYQDVGGGMSGLKEAAKNYLTFGVSGRKYRKNRFDQAEKRQDYLDSLANMSSAQGNYRNDGIYAKKGANIAVQPKYDSYTEPNVEIEDGEIVLGNPNQVTIPTGTNISTSMESSFGAKFHGDKHGQDTDNDGREGIPLNAEGGYVASDYLDLYGRKVKGAGKKKKNNSKKDSKKKQEGGQLKSKTVAKEMEPHIKFLNEAENNLSDPYKNNPVAIKHSVQQLDKMKKMAEKNKFRRELEKMIKDDKIPFSDVISFITENAPVDDFTQEEMGAMQQLVEQQRSAQGGPEIPQGPEQGQAPMDPMSQVPQEVMEQMMGQMPPEMGQAKNGMNMNRKQIEEYMMKNGGKLPKWLYEARAKAIQKSMQEGGQMMPPDDAEIPNESQDRMAELEAKAQQLDSNSIVNPAVNELPADVQKMYAQLPPEVQEQLASLPPEQLEIAIINAFNSMGQSPDMEGAGNLPQPPLPMSMDPGMGQAEGPMPPEMSPEQAAMDQVMMMMGGDMNTYTQNRKGYTDEYFGDQYRMHGGDLQMKDEAAMRERLAHQPRNEYVEKFNPMTGTHTKPHAAFQDHYQTGGAMSSDMTKLYRQYMDMGYSNAAAIEMARQKMGQMKMGGGLKPGMNIKFKSGGKLVSGKVKKINPNGTIELY